MNRQLEGAIAHSRIISVFKNVSLRSYLSTSSVFQNDSSRLYFHTLYTVTTDTGGFLSPVMQYSTSTL